MSEQNFTNLYWPVLFLIWQGCFILQQNRDKLLPLSRVLNQELNPEYGLYVSTSTSLYGMMEKKSYKTQNFNDKVCND